VVVHPHRQLVPSTQPSILQDLPAAFRLHPLAKAVDPNSPPNLGLIGSLWHSITPRPANHAGAPATTGPRTCPALSNSHRILAVKHENYTALAKRGQMASAALVVF
jgi:hypothetical protein